jgi:hypothetical protein
MLITKTSSLTGVEHTIDIDVTFQQLWQIENKTDLIQRIVPHLLPAEREFLMTGITNEEWQEVFADIEE